MNGINGRILFPGNPWPEGHALQEFAWTARLVDGKVWFDLHLRSQPYYSERDIEEDEDAEHEGSWEAPGVWSNYHRCTLSSTYWGEEGGFPVCDIEHFSPDWLDGKTFQVDLIENEIGDDDNLAFHIYLLGHDSVANHRISFQRVGNSNLFDIVWTGDIALTYVGDYMLEHAFEARITGLPFPLIPA